MVILVRLLGIVIVVMGAIFLLKPNVMKPYMAFWAKQKRLYAGAVLSLLFGIIFLLAASQCRLAWVVIVVGVWGVIKGILLFVLGQEKLKSMINWWQEKPITILRLLSLIVIALGALIIYAA